MRAHHALFPRPSRRHRRRGDDYGRFGTVHVHGAILPASRRRRAGPRAAPSPAGSHGVSGSLTGRPGSLGRWEKDTARGRTERRGRPPWSDRRRRTLLGLALGIVAFGLGAIALPASTASPRLLAALCAFLLVAAAVVFVAIPGPDTLRTLLRTVPLAGAVLVVAVLLLLSTVGGPALAVVADRRGRGRLDGGRGLGDPPLGRLTRDDRLQGMELPAALYVPTDDGFEATALTIGPWDPGLQHAGPAGGAAAARGRAGERDRRWADRAAGLRHLRAGAGRAGAGAAPPSSAPAAGSSWSRPCWTAADERPLMRLSAWRMRTRADGAAATEAAPHPAAAGPAGQPPGGGRVLHRGRRLPPGPGVAVRHRQLQLPRTGVGVDPAGVRTGGRRADDPAAAPAGDDRRGQRHLRRAGLEHDDLRQRRPQPGPAPRRRRASGWAWTRRTVLGGTGAAQCYAVLFDETGAIGRSSHALFVEPR